VQLAEVRPTDKVCTWEQHRLRTAFWRGSRHGGAEAMQLLVAAARKNLEAAANVCIVEEP